MRGQLVGSHPRSDPIDGIYTAGQWIYTIYTSVYDPGAYTQIYTTILKITEYTLPWCIYTIYASVYDPGAYTQYTHMPNAI